MLPGPSPTGLTSASTHVSPRELPACQARGPLQWLVSWPSPLVGGGGYIFNFNIVILPKKQKILYPKFFQCLAMCLTSTKESGRAWGGGWMHPKIITALGATAQPAAAPPLRVGVEIREGVGYFTHDGGRAALVAQW